MSHRQATNRPKIVMKIPNYGDKRLDFASLDDSFVSSLHGKEFA
jgi:hypothetical protein